MNGIGKAGKSKGGKSKTRSSRAGLQFPVGRIHRLLRKGNYGERVGAGAPASYLAAEVLQLAIRNDEELNKLLSGVTIAQGGVLPNIQAVLLPKKTEKKEQYPIYAYRCIISSERSDECIDITMIRNNAPISNYRGGFRCKSEYPWCIIEVKSKHFPTVFKKFVKNKKRMTEKREFLQKTSFRPNRLFYMVVIQKLITVPYEFSNFYKICQKPENLQRNDNDLSSNDFNYILENFTNRFLIIQILTKIRQIPEYEAQAIKT
ncbi:histone H2A, partial [Aphis craccivora]